MTGGDAGTQVAARAPRGRSVLRAPSIDTLFVILFAVGGWCAGLRRLGDNSFLWHLETGHLILDDGIPRGDPFSFTVPGARWIAQSWLAEMTYGFLDDVWGPFAIRLLVAATGAAITTVAYLLALRFARDRVRAAVVTVIGFASILTIWSERPLLLGLLAMFGVVWVVEVPDGWVARRGFIVLPALLWLWGNVHGTVALGFVYLGLHLLGRLAEGAPPWRGVEQRLFLASVAGFVFMFANPYGYRLVLFPLSLLSNGETLNSVAEWQSPNFRDLQGMLFASWLALGIVAFSRRRPAVRDLIVTLPFFFLALWALRNIGLAVAVSLPPIARAVAAPTARSEERSPIGHAFTAGLVALAVVWAASAASQPDFDLDDYPVVALEEVDERGLLGERLFTTDAWAGYTIARYWPDQQVFLDDRYDMYPRRIVEDYDKIADVKPGWEGVLDRWRVQVVVWPPQRALSQALAGDADWVRIHRDDDAVVFVRAPLAGT